FAQSFERMFGLLTLPIYEMVACKPFTTIALFGHIKTLTVSIWFNKLQQTKWKLLKF
uniref:Uncharacterized protein n=1 Tax=Oryza brachyantha TaxID=4533 RepID=J3LIA0_ORYBR